MAAARVAVAAVAAFWGLLFYGVIDLIVVPIQDEQFYVHYLLETGWGLLFTVLVMVPLLLWVARPGSLVFPQQVVVVAGAVLVGGLAAPAAGQVVAGVALAVSVALPITLAVRSRWPLQGLTVRGVSPWLGVLVVVAAIVAVVYAVQMTQAAQAGKADDDTWGLMHLPMQASFGLALAGSAAVTALAGAADAAGWRLSALPAAVSAGWIGAVSVAYPGHLGSLGHAGGILAIGWGIAFATLSLSLGRGSGRTSRV